MKFRRQHELGPYFVDFFCVDARLALELDGGQHFEEQKASADRERDEWLARRGIHVLRFTNLEVMREIDSVVAAIEAELARRHARGRRPSP